MHDDELLMRNERIGALAIGACLNVAVISTLRAAAGGDQGAPIARLLRRSVALIGGTAACSIGLWHFLHWRSYRQHYMREHAREAWELENFEDGEKQEMVELFVGKGMGQEDARIAIDACAKYPEFFVSMMMLEELHMVEPSLGSSQALSSLKMALTCGAGALVPALPLLLAGDESRPAVFAAAVQATLGASLATITGAGVAKASSIRLPKLQHAADHTLFGFTCMTAPHAIMFGWAHLLRLLNR